jgi:hypothetical protein
VQCERRCRGHRTGHRLGEAPGRGVLLLLARLLLLLLSSLFLWCGDGGMERGTGARALGGGLGGFLWGGPRVCGAGLDTEGSDARRPCHGHAVRIRQLLRGVRVCGAGGRGVGKKGGHTRGRLRWAVAERGVHAGSDGDASGSRGTWERGSGGCSVLSRGGGERRRRFEPGEGASGGRRES